MRDKCEGKVPPLRLFLQPLLQVLHAREDHRTAAPSGDGRHLRVVGSADNHRLPSLLLRPGHDVVDPLDIGAGGVQDVRALCLQSSVGLPALAVGADDDPVSRRDVLYLVHRRQALPGQTAHHVPAVDDRAQHHTGAAGGRGFPGQLHCPAHTVAEAGRLGQTQLHSNPSPRR